MLDLKSINHVLCVCAHPDDEVLGFGGTASALARKGIPTTALFLCAAANQRHLGESKNELVESAIEVSNHIGIKNTLFADFPNLALHNVDSYKIVKEIENAIIQTSSDLIVTHHPSDLNVDHQTVSNLCLAAGRLSQRRPDLSINQIRGIVFMEILSSTDWAYPSNTLPFNPNLFFEISEGDLSNKVNALKLYKGVSRPRPHPRNKETLKALSELRGSQCGALYAEAFESCFEFTSLL